MKFSINTSLFNEVNSAMQAVPSGSYVVLVTSVNWVESTKDGRELDHPFFEVKAKIVDGEYSGRSLRCCLVLGVPEGEGYVSEMTNDERVMRKLVALMSHLGMKAMNSNSPANVAKAITAHLPKSNRVRFTVELVEDENYNGRLHNLRFVASI